MKCSMWEKELETESLTIDESMDARRMREKIKDYSEWAPYQHGFETHLRALVASWGNAKKMTKNIENPYPAFFVQEYDPFVDNSTLLS